MKSRKGCQSQCKGIQRLYRQACLIFASKVALLYDVAIPELIVLRFGIVWRYYVKYSKFVQHAVGVTRHMLMIFLFFCFSGHWCWNTVNTCENHILCKCARVSQSLNGFSQNLVCTYTLKEFRYIALIMLFFKSQLICFFAMFQHFLHYTCVLGMTMCSLLYSSQVWNEGNRRVFMLFMLDVFHFAQILRSFIFVKTRRATREKWFKDNALKVKMGLLENRL